ncbi:hypothetical protein E4U30_004725 [Claviceps sp. LM220 group G6]|nr:hypothetical protein E4U30_004725 [Claviceps sp. LM220 group G6]
MRAGGLGGRSTEGARNRGGASHLKWRAPDVRRVGNSKETDNYLAEGTSGPEGRSFGGADNSGEASNLEGVVFQLQGSGRSGNPSGLRAEVPTPTPDFLTSEDWEELRSTNKALKNFGDATLVVEGHKTFLSSWLSVMDELLDVINNVKTAFKERRDKDRNEHTNFPKRRKTKDKDEAGNDLLREARADRNDYLAKCSELAWGKAEKYFLTCDRAPAYYLCRS